jgi:hypothetical protein
MARTASKKKDDKNSDKEERDQILNVIIDRCTEGEAAILGEEIKKVKRKLAPKARGTYIQGSENTLLGYFKNRISGLLPGKDDE